MNGMNKDMRTPLGRFAVLAPPRKALAISGISA